MQDKKKLFVKKEKKNISMETVWKDLNDKLFCLEIICWIGFLELNMMSTWEKEMA